MTFRVNDTIVGDMAGTEDSVWNRVRMRVTHVTPEKVHCVAIDLRPDIDTVRPRHETDAQRDARRAGWQATEMVWPLDKVKLAP